MQHIIDNHPDMATALLAGEKLKELILPGQQDDKAGALAALLLQLKLELPFDRVVTIGTVLIPILLVTLVFTKNFAGKGGRTGRVVSQWLLNETTGAERYQPALALAGGDSGGAAATAAEEPLVLRTGPPPLVVAGRTVVLPRRAGTVVSPSWPVPNGDSCCLDLGGRRVVGRGPQPPRFVSSPGSLICRQQ